MTDHGRGDLETPARPRLQTGVPELDVIVGLPGTGKTTLGNQYGFHYAATASLLTLSVAPAQAPSTDARA